MSEASEHKVFVQWFYLKYPQYKDLLHHSPNGEKRDKITGKKLKDMGVTPGWPDIELAVVTKKYPGLYIEIKDQIVPGKAKTYPSKVQKNVIAQLQEQGYRVEVCWGFLQAKAVIEDYLPDSNVIYADFGSLVDVISCKCNSCDFYIITDGRLACSNCKSVMGNVKVIFDII